VRSPAEDVDAFEKAYSTHADNERVNTLVKSTMNIIRPNLQGLLVRAQTVSATLKREGRYSTLAV
jgi:hypothetical protein